VLRGSSSDLERGDCRPGKGITAKWKVREANANLKVELAATRDPQSSAALGDPKTIVFRGVPEKKKKVL